jgi:hypothetical protein
LKNKNPTPESVLGQRGSLAATCLVQSPAPRSIWVERFLPFLRRLADWANRLGVSLIGKGGPASATTEWNPLGEIAASDSRNTACAQAFGAPWIGVDLDGTLAEWTPDLGVERIGEPVPEMIERVRVWIAEGYRVKIFTARACAPALIPPIREWLQKHHLPDLEVTNAKDFAMIELWDDRCVQVHSNLGQPVTPSRPAANGLGAGGLTSEPSSK